MIIPVLSAFLAVAAPASAAPASAPAPVQTLIGTVGAPDASRRVAVELIFLGGQGAGNYDLPASIPAELGINGQHVTVVLERQVQTPARVTLSPGGFVRGAYVLQLPAGAMGLATLSLPARAAASVAFDAGTPVASPPPTAIAAASETPSPAVADEHVHGRHDSGNAFWDSISAYEPIYAVYGPGTDTEARLQVSFKYQLFGKGGENGPGDSWLNNIQLGYTQRMYWDLRGQSSPFRNIDFRPEIFYLLPARRLSSGLALGGQAGVLHQSNGRDGAFSRSYNALYIQPTAEMPVGHYKFSLGVRFQTYIGDLSDNPDIADYRGRTELFAEVGRDDGLRVSTVSRMSFQTGRAAINIEASYPLNRVMLPSLNLYLFGQAFIGYGENLLDYNIRTTRFRIGIAIVR